MSHLTTSSALGARPALARAPVLATRRLSAASWLAIAFFAGALLFGAVALAMGDVFYLRLATEALIFGGLALSVDLLLGRVGLLPLGQALFFGLGAYVSALVLKHWADSLWLALGVTLVFSALAGLIGGLIAIRSKGVYFALISFGLAQVVSKFVYNTRELGASDGIIGVPAASLAPGVTSGTPEVFFLLVLAFIGALYLGLRYLMNTPMGRQLDAIRINEHRVSFLGVDAWRYKLGAFVAAACIAGLSGALYPMLRGFVSPELMFFASVSNGAVGAAAGTALAATSEAVATDIAASVAGTLAEASSANAGAAHNIAPDSASTANSFLIIEVLLCLPVQMAAAPVSPVRIRITCSRS